MKEQYVSPEVKLFGFAPIETLASDFSIDADDVFGDTSSGVSANPDLDLDVPVGGK